MSLLLTALKENPFVIAPMAGITDHAYRTFIRKHGSSVAISELISANGIEFGNQRTIEMMGYDDVQRPIAIQLFGEDPQVMARAAQFVESKGVDFVDINFGCPVPKVTKKGAGSAMLKDLPLMKSVLRSIVSSIKIPVTIKIRTGWDHDHRNAHEVVQLAHDEGITWVAIHGRTRSQNYEGKADWDYIGEVKAKSKLPILGNGDILTAQDACIKLKQYSLDGVLIGRGALRNPFIFDECLQLWKGLPEIMERPFTLALEELNQLYSLRCTDRVREIQLRKFAAWFSTGLAESSSFRKKLFQCQNSDTILTESKTYFAKVNRPSETTHEQEDFLMGGHG